MWVMMGARASHKTLQKGDAGSKRPGSRQNNQERLTTSQADI